MAPKFGKLEIFENIEAGEGLGHQKSRIFFAGANFIALRRRGSYFKCLVEWLHRRGIASAGAIAHTNVLVRCMLFRSLDEIFLVEKNRLRKCIRIMQLHYCWISFSESMTASRCEMEKLYVPTLGWCMPPKFRKFEIVENIEAGEGFGHQKSRICFVGANFIACGAAARLGAGAAAAPE